MQQIDSVSNLVSQIPMINLLFMAANTYMMLTVKLAIQELKTQIALDRKKDSDDMQEWVKKEITGHSLQCSSVKS